MARGRPPLLFKKTKQNKTKKEKNRKRKKGKIEKKKEKNKKIITNDQIAVYIWVKTDEFLERVTPSPQYL